MGVTERWSRLSRGVVESPSLGIFKTCLGVIQCSVLQVTLLGRGVGPFGPQLSCDSLFCFGLRNIRNVLGSLEVSRGEQQSR